MLIANAYVVGWFWSRWSPS